VASAEDGEPLAERNAYIGEATNNVAEYRALLLGLELARELGALEV
jgi:ribonuclease HI